MVRSYVPSGSGYSFVPSRRTTGGYTPSVRGGYTYTPRKGLISRTVVLSGVEARRGGYPTVYGTLVGTPMGEAAYWATRGMSRSMRGATIGAIETAYRSPETLSAHERELIEPHLSKMPKEFQRKYHQAGIKIKLKKFKKDIQPKRRDVARKVPTKVADVPGVTMSALYGATPETAKAIQLGLSKAPIVLAGERLGIEAEKLRRWTTGEVSASQKAIIAMEPSYTKAGELYTGRIATHEAKWEPYIKDEEFVGKPYKYREYLKEFGDIKREGAQLETQYETFGQLEVSAEREEKERFWGLEAPIKRKQEEVGSWIAARTPKVLTTEEIRAKTKKGDVTAPDIFAWGLGTRTSLIESDMAREDIRGMYEGLREEPFKTVTTTAVFAALPPVLKGAKHVAKAARVAPAVKYIKPLEFTWKKGIPKIKQIPKLKRGAPVKVGAEKGILPSSARHIPKVVGYGMGAAYAGVLGHEMYVTPPSERAYKLGRMTTTEIAPMIAGTYIGVKVPAMFSGGARAARIALLRKKIKIEKLTPEQIIAAKKEIVYIEKGVTPAEFKKSAYDLQYEYGISTRHLTPEQYMKLRIKTGKLGGVYDVKFPFERQEYLGMHVSPKHMKGWPKEDVVATAKWLGMPSDIDPLKSQIMIAKGLRQARLKAQMRLGKQYIEFVAREKELPQITKGAMEKWEGAHPSYKRIRAHELFHERYRATPEERIVELEIQYAAARGKARKMFPVGEVLEPGVKLWKAMPYEWGGKTVIRRGHFEMPGGYGSPEVQPFFFRIGRQKTKFELFGSDFPTPEIGPRPTAMRMTVKDVARLPKKVRATRDPYSMTAYALGKGEVGKAYVSIPIELGTKMESEFVISPTTGMKRTPSPTGKEYYTTWKKRVIPIEHYEWFETGMKRPQIGLESGKYYVKRPRATAIIETEKGIVLHPGERGEGLILPGGGIETAAEVAAKKGVKVVGERAAEAAMREVHEELGVSVSGISERLFKYKSTEIPIYSRGRQKWYSKSYHDVFAVDIIGKPKPVSREVSKVVYWKPESKMKLSKDTEAILKEYAAAKKRRVISKEPVTKERMKRVVSKAELQKERIKKGEVKTFEESLKYDEYDMYSQTQRRAALISPMGLGIEYGIKEVTRGPSYVPMQYKEVIAKDVAYPKYAQKEYVSKPYVSKRPTKYTTHVSYQEQKPIKYTKPIKHKKRVPYGKPKLTKYPEVVPYPEPTPTPYPKPTPTPTPKIIPYPEPEPTPKPKLIKYPEPFIVPSVLIEPKRKKQPRAKKKPYAWKVKNPIPELQQMFTQEVQKRGPKLL